MMPRRFAVAWRLSLVAVAAGLLQSLFWTPTVPIVLKLATALFGAFALGRPQAALLVLAAALPFTYTLTTRVWSAHPLHLGEALVLAWLAAAETRTLARLEAPSHRPAGLSAAAWIFAWVMLASCAVQVAILQAWHDYPLPYARRVATYLLRDYLTTAPDIRPWVEGHGFVATAALLLEGLALMLAVRGFCRRDPGLARRVLWAVVLAGAGAAAVNVVSLLQHAAEGDPAILGGRANELRWTAFIPSLNTSGAYFLLVLFPALGLAVSSRPRAARVATATGAAAIALAALWFTKTYAAIVAAVVVATGSAAWLAVRRTRLVTGRRAAVAAAALAALVGAGTVALNPFGVLTERAYLSLHLRALFAETALRMWAAHPLFGAGVGQYGLLFPAFSSAELLRYYARADAHNYFLWVAAEFGLVGLAAFLWLLWAAALDTWRHWRVHPADASAAGLCAGLGAFAITWLGGQPLSVPIVAYTFFILLGVAARGDRLQRVSPDPKPTAPRSSRWVRGALGLAVVGLAASVPFRVHRAVEEIDFRRVSYGFYDWETEGAHLRYRWTGRQATVFVPMSVRAVTLPLRTGLDPKRMGTDAVEVRIFVDRRRAGLVQLTDDRWRAVRVPRPALPTSDRFWRIDLEITPTWRPADYLPGSTDRRRLGVKVGEVEAADAR